MVLHYTEVKASVKLIGCCLVNWTPFSRHLTVVSCEVALHVVSWEATYSQALFRKRGLITRNSSLLWKRRTFSQTVCNWGSGESVEVMLESNPPLQSDTLRDTQWSVCRGEPKAMLVISAVWKAAIRTDWSSLCLFTSLTQHLNRCTDC